ncbi:lysophospholipid acyltransferase family protein [Rothia nasimurium]|uniref:lysophospholipid acyltransferase family protein n=1 Tax=Rothia nasimurium TaxID=85336 RepID=UPI001F40A66E|nr:lysophospholipid acyltransferase family protein [Rothia nasimurium]
MSKNSASLSDIKPTKMGDTVYTVAGTLLRPLYNLPMKAQIEGREKLPKTGGFIVVSNHLTVIDPITAAYPLFLEGVLPRFLAKEALFRVPVLGWLMRQCAHIPVARGSARAGQSLEVAQNVLDAGGAVIIFPEGTLTKDPDMWPMTGKSGAARLALATGAPVYPVAHWGDQDFWPRRGKPRFSWPRKKVKIVVGDPVDFSDLVQRREDGARYTHDELAAVTNRMLDDVTALLEGLRGEKAPAGRWNAVLDVRQSPDQ